MLLPHFGWAQDSVQHYAYGTSGTDLGIKAIPVGTEFYLFGSTGGVGFGQSDLYVVRLDSTMTPKSFKPFGTFGIETLTHVEYDSSSGSFYLASVVYDGFSSTDYDVQITLIDTSLTQLASRTFTSSGNDECVSLAINSQNVSLFIQRFNTDDAYRHVLLDLNLQNPVEFDFQLDSFHLADHRLTSNEIQVLGDGVPTDSNNRNILFIQLDYDGQILNQNDFGSSRTDFASHLLYVNDSTWLFTGSTNGIESDGSDYDAYAALVHSNDSLIWQQSMGHSTTVQNQDDFGIESFVHPNGSIYIGMSTRTFGQPLDFHLYNYSINGNFINGNSFGLEKDETLENIGFKADSSYWLFGSTESMGAGQSDFFFVQTTSAKKSTNLTFQEDEDTVNPSDQAMGLSEVGEASDFRIARGQESWQLHFESDLSGEAALYNLVGQEVWRSSFTYTKTISIPFLESIGILELSFTASSRRVFKLMK